MISQSSVLTVITNFFSEVWFRYKSVWRRTVQKAITHVMNKFEDDELKTFLEEEYFNDDYKVSVLKFDLSFFNITNNNFKCLKNSYCLDSYSEHTLDDSLDVNFRKRSEQPLNLAYKPVSI